ncbi:hypothetical protein AURDEDRAFT_161511 [Auricularia subglabra TFB-10046 SS5]|nr:hypothetical protein AURDEDRAFT_161511 [Auricularia subglabra TFB-10046 SS5]
MPQELDTELFVDLLVMYSIPEALRVTVDLIAVEGPTLVAFEALENTAEIGEMWSIAVSAEESAKNALEGMQKDLKAADTIVIKKIEAAQGDLVAAVEEQEKMVKELGQSFVDWHESVRKAEEARPKRRNKRKEKKMSEPEVSEGRSKIKDSDPVDGTYRETPCALCEHGRFACYDKLEAKGTACVASKQPCFIPTTGALKSILKGIMERLDSTDGKLDELKEKYEHLATGLKAIKGILKEQGKCLASLVALQAENQQFLEAIAEKFDGAPSKSTGKRRERKKRAFKPMVVSDVVQLEDKDEDEDEGPSKKRRKVEKAKPGMVASESEDEVAAEKAKGKEKEKEKTPEGLVDETLQSD